MVTTSFINRIHCKFPSQFDRFIFFNFRVMKMVGVISGGCSSAFSAARVRFPINCRCLPSKTLLFSSYLGRSSNLMSHKLYSTTTACKSTSSTATEGEVLEPPFKKPQPWLIVGLGNPGKRYNGTRHNVGFEMVDSIAKAEGISMSSVSFKTLFGKGFIGNVPVMLAKPQTFMNVSGESVGAIVSYYKIPVTQVLVIYDDLDLPFAKMRLLPKGGHGGHNGMKSVINHLKGSRDFPRLRIGIGRPPGKMDPVNFVLRPFNKQEREELEFTFQNGIEAMQILLHQGFNKSATFVNSAKAMEHFG